MGNTSYHTKACTLTDAVVHMGIIFILLRWTRNPYQLHAGNLKDHPKTKSVLLKEWLKNHTPTKKQINKLNPEGEAAIKLPDTPPPPEPEGWRTAYIEGVVYTIQSRSSVTNYILSARMHQNP